MLDSLDKEFKAALTCFKNQLQILLNQMKKIEISAKKYNLQTRNEMILQSKAIEDLNDTTDHGI